VQETAAWTLLLLLQKQFQRLQQQWQETCLIRKLQW
jgi:hypothetical protein